MINKIKITVSILIVALLCSGFLGIKCFDEYSLDGTRKRIESKFSGVVNLDAIDCNQLRDSITRNNWPSYSLFVIGPNGTSIKEVESQYCKRLEKFVELNLRQIDNPQDTAIVWCIKPVIRSRNGEYWGEASAIIILRYNEWLDTSF